MAFDKLFDRSGRESANSGASDSERGVQATRGGGSASRPDLVSSPSADSDAPLPKLVVPKSRPKKPATKIDYTTSSEPERGVAHKKSKSDDK